MPKIYEIKGFKFFFYSNEGDPRENYHIHVRKDQSIAKFWLTPNVILASSYGFQPKDLTFLQKVTEEKQQLFKEKWDEYFNSTN